jgi:hypothetical protein
MPTLGSGSFRLLFCCLCVVAAAGCGGSVGQDPSATHSGGSAGSGGASSGGASSGGASSGGSGGGCDWNGHHYADNEQWSNGCSQCTCSGGQPACGLNLCGCDYDGSFHAVGSSFPASDGCNTCTCQQSNQVVCTQLACASAGCDYNGSHYDVGQTWSFGDCNSCTCMSDGSVACTGMYCPGCLYGGQVYQEGSTFPALDGCNTCSCSMGTVSCTKLACQCDPSTEWWHDYLTTDPATCATVKYSCPANTTPFENQCGCGCEEDLSCPQVIDCMPPATDCSAMMAKCPFSSVAK